jgi:hypothetical protein
MRPNAVAKIPFRLLSLAIIMTLTINYGYSQKGPDKQKKKEMIETQKVSFITKYLDLTTTEAEKFWPVYNEFIAKKQELINKHKGNKINKKIDEMTDKEAETLVNQQIIEAQELLDLKKTYLMKYKEVLPMKKLAKLTEAENEFKKYLLKQANQQKPNKDYNK